jgi:dienelactone hydrolase
LTRRWALCALLLAAPMLHAQEGSRVHMHGSEGYAADGFLWEPTESAKGAAVLIIPGAKGVTDHIKEEAHRIGTLGMVAIVVDLSRGQPLGGSQTPADAAGNDALHDLKAALSFLRAQPNVHAGAIGLEGWGLGGLYALRLARSDLEIRAVAVTLTQSPDPTVLADLGRPLLVNLPHTDNHRLLSLAKKPGSGVKIYPDAHDDFFDPESPNAFRAKDADDARSRIEKFLTEQLVSDAPAPGASSGQGASRPQ